MVQSAPERQDAFWMMGRFLQRRSGAEGNAKPSQVRQFRTEALPRRRTPGPQTIQPDIVLADAAWLRPRHQKEKDDLVAKHQPVMNSV